MAKRNHNAKPAPEPKHTGAPWTVKIVEPGKIALISSLDSIAGMRNSGDFLPDEFDANARLIGAAPDLYDALKEMVDAYWGEGDGGRPPSMVAAAYRALRKAEGR